MAISTTNNTGYLSILFSKWAEEFDLSDIRIDQDVQRNMAIVMLRRGKAQVRFMVDADLFGMGNLQRGLQEVKDMVYVNAKKLPQSRLDMRYNSIEGMNDFLTLVSREREKMNDIDTVILTPEQATTLQREAMMNRPDLMGQPILTIYGYAVETKGQD